MKKYWKVLLVSVLTVVVIGTFYIQSSLAANNYANFTIETISGDKEIGKKILITGDYIYGNMHQTLQISEKGTVNTGNLSIIQQIKRSYRLPVFKDIMSRYKSFLRGKELSLNNFYEDDEILVYVDIKKDEFYGSMKKATFKIDVLNKETNQSVDKKLEFPDKSKYSWVNLRDIQAVNGELKVLVEGYFHDGVSEIVMYSFSLDDLQLKKTESILEAKDQENVYHHMSFLNDSFSKDKENYYLFLKETDIYSDENGNFYRAATEYEVFSYSLVDNQLKTVTVPESLIPFLMDGKVFQGNLYIPVKMSEENYDIYRYNIENDKWNEKLSFFFENVSEGTNPFMKIEKGQIYFVYAVEDGYMITISSLDTGETLYEGKMKMTKEKEEQKDYYLLVHEMELI